MDTTRRIIDARTLSPAGQQAALESNLAIHRIMEPHRGDPRYQGYFDALARLDAEDLSPADASSPTCGCRPARTVTGRAGDDAGSAARDESPA